MEEWYILSDIPYQKGFPPVIDIDWEPNTYYWSITVSIPYMHEFPDMISINQRPLNPDIWFILSGIPYHQEFPEMVAINTEPGADSWYILDNIPYMKEYPQIKVIDVRPLNPDIWHINNSIPYQKEFPPLYVIEQIVFEWYIMDSIPYMPQFSEINVINAKPLNPDIWYIDDSIPYHKEFPPLYKPEPIVYQWYILDDIPYMPSFPEMCVLDDKPMWWFINDSIPYMKEYPPLYTIQPITLTWYILDSIPYLKQFPEMCAIDAKPTKWYILDSIPYMKEFPEMIPIDTVPNIPWYILNAIPYMKEFPPMYPIDAKPIHWYILYSIPYLKEFPKLYPVEAIPQRLEKHYYTVGIAAIGRWQVRTSPFSKPDEWTLIEDLGPTPVIKRAYIEADGDFTYIAGNDSITLTTTDTPWMAVITTTKKLYVKQVCADIETAILLDTEVEQASLCRGWKSDKYSVDSGLICAYRKADGVYAKVYKKIDGEYVWETLPQLLYEPVDHVEVKRLNDYRIGVYVTNPNRLLLSERFYIGGTSKTEYISVKLKPWANVCSFSMVGEPAEQIFKVERCWMEEDTKVRMHCNYPIVSFDPEYPNLTLTDDYNYSKLVEYYIQNGDLVCILDKPKYSSFNTIRIVIPDINHILYQITPQFKRTIPGGQYAVENPPITEYIDVQLTVAAGEFKTVQKQNYRINYNTEHIDVNLSAQVGVFSSIPLARKTYTYNTETISVSLSSAAGVFTTTQQGDLPI